MYCSHTLDKPKLVQYVRKIDLKSNLFGRLMSGKILQEQTSIFTIWLPFNLSADRLKGNDK